MNIGVIIEILEYLYENSNDLEKRRKEVVVDYFGKEKYEHFKRYCYGANNFAYENKTDPIGIINLTDMGINELYRLKDESSRKTQTWLMMLATGAVAIASILQTIALIYGQEAAIITIEGWRISIGQLLIAAIAIIIIAKFIEYGSSMLKTKYFKKK